MAGQTVGIHPIGIPAKIEIIGIWFPCDVTSIQIDLLAAGIPEMNECGLEAGEEFTTPWIRREPALDYREIGWVNPRRQNRPWGAREGYQSGNHNNNDMIVTRRLWERTQRERDPVSAPVGRVLISAQTPTSEATPRQRDGRSLASRPGGGVGIARRASERRERFLFNVLYMGQSNG